MEKRSTKKKRKLLVFVAVAIAAAIVASVVLYSLFAGTSNSFQLTDPANDVVLNVGTQYPGMIDVVSASLAVNGAELNVTINLRSPVSNLSDSEYAQWNVTLVLQNETDVLKTYEICVNMNSTQMTAQIEDVDTQTVQNCQVEYHQNSLTVRSVIDELPRTKTIEWGIVTTYEQYSGGELITSASDLAPDEGLQETVLTP
jgi:hypothetical protein